MFPIVFTVWLAACYILWALNQCPNDDATVRVRLAMRILFLGAAVALLISFVVDAHIPVSCSNISASKNRPTDQAFLPTSVFHSTQELSG
jgi:hypothetical protein